MKKEYQDIISKYLNVEPIEINSSCLSAQNRVRLYWTNIPNIQIPEDKGILLKDIIESGMVDRDKSLCLTRRYAGFAGSQSYLRRRYFGKSMGQAVFENCTPELQKEYWKKDNRKEWENIGTIRSLTVSECEKLQTLPVGYIGNILSEADAKSAIGNGWTVDVIAHILHNLKIA
jgi:predicted transcriptional regulator